MLKRPRVSWLRRRGFTLLEVITTVAIIAILAAATVPTIRGQLRNGEANALVEEIENLRTAISTYKSDVGRFPPNLGYLSTLPTGRANELDACGDELTVAESAAYRGPYTNRKISSDYKLAAGDSVEETLVYGGTSITINISAVDTAVAEAVDQAIDGVGGLGGKGTGQLTWNVQGQSTRMSFLIPIRSGSC